jgi:hypothetical protein
MEEGDTTWRLLGDFETAQEDNEEISWIYDPISNKYSMHVLSVRLLLIHKYCKLIYILELF